MKRQVMETIAEKAQYGAYGGGSMAFVGGFTFSQITQIIGIGIAILSMLIQLVFKYRQDKRDAYFKSRQDEREEKKLARQLK